MGEVKESVQGKGLTSKPLATSKPPPPPSEDGEENDLSPDDALKVAISDAQTASDALVDAAESLADSPPQIEAENLVEYIMELRERVSELLTQKDQDVLDEGDEEKSENIRKAALLRAVHSLLVSAQRLLEDYS